MIRGSPLGVMPTLVVPSVLLVLIGTCPYFLSTTREIVVWSNGDCADWSRKEKEGYKGRMGRGKGEYGAVLDCTQRERLY